MNGASLNKAMLEEQKHFDFLGWFYVCILFIKTVGIAAQNESPHPFFCDPIDMNLTEVVGTRELHYMLCMHWVYVCILE